VRERAPAPIHCRDAIKRFGDFLALDPVSIDVIFGLSAHRTSPLFALASFAIYLLSLVLYGWLWDRRAASEPRP